MGRLTAIVLGAAAGGGFPQWNCQCPICRLAWTGDRRAKPRTQASLAVTADGEEIAGEPEAVIAGAEAPPQVADGAGPL